MRVTSVPVSPGTLALLPGTQVSDVYRLIVPDITVDARNHLVAPLGRKHIWPNRPTAPKRKRPIKTRCPAISRALPSAAPGNSIVRLESNTRLAGLGVIQGLDERKVEVPRSFPDFQICLLLMSGRRFKYFYAHQ
jgi:hypothetical protein